MTEEPDKNSSSSLTRDKLYEKYQLDRQWDYPKNVPESEAYYENSKYPPDWGKDRDDIPNPMGGRREAVLEFQNDACARCGKKREDADSFEVHHFRELSEGGQNSLENLIGLCGPCHALSHPDVEVMNADWRDSSLFPAVDADARVATVRKPVTEDEADSYLPELAYVSEISKPVENERATSSATIPMSPADARTASKDLDTLLRNVGIGDRTQQTVRIVNEAHNPITNARIEIGLPDPVDDAYTLTDGDGEATITLPEGQSSTLRITADNFEPETIEYTHSSGDQVTSVVLSYTGEPIPADSEADTSPGVDSGESSRRSVLTYAGGAITGLAGLWYLRSSVGDC